MTTAGTPIQMSAVRWPSPASRASNTLVGMSHAVAVSLALHPLALSISRLTARSTRSPCGVSFPAESRNVAEAAREHSPGQASS